MAVRHWGDFPIEPKMRLISDNDYSGDPDGLVQLAHHLLSPTVETRAILASHLRAGDSWNRFDDSVEEAVKEVRNLQEIMNLQEIIDPSDIGKKDSQPLASRPKVLPKVLSKVLPKVLRGARGPLVDRKTPADSEAARFIIEEAMNSDSALPLFVVCGGSLTSIASAWLINPEIASKLTVVWIGGPEHQGHSQPPPGASQYEYNLHEDVIAGQVIFNDSDLRLWQIPRNAYRQLNTSQAELELRMNQAGLLGSYLYQKLSSVAVATNRLGFKFGETYMLGDSALVLLTALQSTFEADPSSSSYFDLPKPRLKDDGSYEDNPAGVPMRVYSHLDVRLTTEDLYAKLLIHEKSRGATT